MANARIIDHAFDRAAHSYDTTATIQAEVAETLVTSAPVFAPRSILDIGCGTGFVLTRAAARWPQAQLTGLDLAPAMLSEAKRKIARLSILRADAGTCDLDQRFDLIFSSMMLHWLAQPAEILRRWQRWLTPQGVLCVAVPVAGSLGAWRDLCDEAGVGHGVWPFPPSDFANGLASDRVLRQHAMSYEFRPGILARVEEVWRQHAEARSHADFLCCNAKAVPESLSPFQRQLLHPVRACQKARCRS